MESARPKISVLIPVYNVEKTLARCLDSVVSQSLRDIEIICVDDASPDGSAQILRQYSERDSRLKIISKARNEGLMMARKTGYRAARGEFLFFLDSDDYLTPDSLARMYEACEKEGADLAVADYYFERPNGLRTYTSKTALLDDNPETFLKTMTQGRTSCTVWGLLFSASLFDGHEYVTFMNQSFSEDRILLLQVLKNVRRVALVRYPALVYVLNSCAMTRNRLSDEKLVSQLKALAWCRDYAQETEALRIPARVHYARYLSFFVESGYPLGLIYEAVPGNREILSYSSLKNLLGVRLALHTRLSASSRLYQRTASKMRLVLRRIIKRF